MCLCFCECVCVFVCVCVCAFVCMDGVGAQDARTKGQSYGVTMHVQKSNPIWERTNLCTITIKVCAQEIRCVASIVCEK